MADTGALRKLATIVALDVAGYSARTEADEAKTTADVAKLRKIIKTIAKAHGGRIFNTAGDGFMLEFGSSLSAVEAAFELAEKCEPKVRVGVHVGDVVVQPNGDLLGHGVNVAARLMAQSAPGAALVSADVQRMIRGPILDRFVSRGPLKLDKMVETIEAFALATSATAIVTVPPKSAEPLLAVLPFDNLSNDPEMQFFSDGVSEEIHYALTRAAGLGVIGRTSAFQFRGADKKNAAGELKATHILDGAVRKAGHRMRVNAELTEVSSGRNLWADRYDRDIADALALQDEIASEVSAALKTFLPSQKATPVDPEAYELFLRAQRTFSDVTDEEAQQAEGLLQQVVARSPHFARAWALLAIAKTTRLPIDHDAVGEPLHAAGVAAAHKALAIDPNCAQAFQALTGLKPGFSEHGEKLQLIERAVALAPNEPWVIGGYAGALFAVGRCKECISPLARAAALEPMVSFFAMVGAVAMCTAGRVAESIDLVEAARRRMPGSPFLWFIHWQILFSNGQLVDAQKVYAPEASVPGSVTPNEIERVRLMTTLSQSPLSQRESFVRTILDSARNISVPLNSCVLAAHFGCSDLAFENLFAALDSRRPIGTTFGTRGINRSNITSHLFGFLARRMRSDVRFPRLCARMGLVEYWTTSGQWPDCADDVPYDFKAECEKAAREVAKA